LHYLEFGLAYGYPYYGSLGGYSYDDGYDDGRRAPQTRRQEKRERSIRTMGLLLEPVGRDRVELAWTEPDADIVSVEFYTAKQSGAVMDSLTVQERPYAVTLPIPPPDGFVGVTVHYRDGSVESRREPLRKMLPGQPLQPAEVL